MSWPGENEPAPGGTGRGRRRRADSPPEDPYAAAQNSGGTGRRGSGEYERPAEYVQRAEEEAAAYDEFSGYADPSYYRQDSYPAQSSQGYSAPSQQDYSAQIPQGYQGYSAPVYPDAPAPAPPARTNLNSSGFYPVAQPTYPADPAASQVSMPQAPAPRQPAFPQQPVWPQPVPQDAEAESPALPPEPSSRFAARPRTPEPDVAASGESGSPVLADDAELSNWLHFVESRADQRAERARRRRVQLIALSVVLALLGVGAGVWYLLSGGGGVKATQTTVLLQVKDQDGNAVGSVILVADKEEIAGKPGKTSHGASLLVPAEMTVETSGLDTQPFGGAMPAVPPAPKDALTTLLGVEVDGVWSMDQLTFASFLDNLIGVTVDVDPASAATIVDPTGKPVFQPGKQDMTGTKAAVYATYRPKGEAPAKQLARFGQVVQAMLAKVPKNAATTTSLLNSLAVVPDPSLPNDRLAGILTALGAEAQGNRFTQSSLPLKNDGSGLMDLDAASQVVRQLLAGAAHSKDNGGLTRVAIGDGTGRADTVSSRAMAASKLYGGGYTPVDEGPVTGSPTTYIVVPNDDGRTLGKQIALSLGLPETVVRVAPFDTTLSDARVVLGADWTQIAQVPADQPLVPTPSDGATTAPGEIPSKPSETGKVTTARSGKPSASRTR